MKDTRVKVFHQSLDDLVEALDATLRIARWDAAEDLPPPLKESAGKLMARLGTADRLAGGVFNGNPRDAARVGALTDAMRRLEKAYLAYAGKSDSDSGRDAAIAELSSTLDKVRTETLGAE